MAAVEATEKIKQIQKKKKKENHMKKIKHNDKRRKKNNISDWAERTER